MRLFTLNDETLSIAGWARKIGISRERMRQRLRDHPLEVALTTDRDANCCVRRTSGRGKQYSCDGESHTVREWAAICGISTETMRVRLRCHPICVAIKMLSGNAGRPARTITYKGQTRTITAWAGDLELTPSALARRLEMYPPQIALTRKRYEHG